MRQEKSGAYPLFLFFKLTNLQWKSTLIEGLIVRTKKFGGVWKNQLLEHVFILKVFRGLLKKGIASISENFGA